MTATRQFTTRVDEPLLARFEPEERLAMMSDDNKVKGMFFASAMKRLGPDFEAVRPTLAEPPRFGTYIPFANYSQRDYGRVLIAASRKVYPDLPLSEGLRRLARDSFKTFAGSRVGGFFIAVSKEPMELLERVPSVLSAISNNTQARFEQRGERQAFIVAEGHSGWSDCSYVGVLEGAVLHYGEQPVIDVAITGQTKASFEVRW